MKIQCNYCKSPVKQATPTSADWRLHSNAIFNQLEMRGMLTISWEWVGGRKHETEYYSLCSDTDDAWVAVVRRLLRVKAKLLMYGLIYMPTLSYSHKLLLVTKRTKLGNKQLMLKCLHWDCCTCDPDLDKRQRMDGQNFSSSLITSLFLSQLHTICCSDSRPPSYGPQIICCGLDCHQNMAEIFSFSNL